MGKIASTIGGVGKVIIVLALMFVLMGVIATIVTYTDGMTTEFKGFYIVWNGERVLESKNNLRLHTNKENQIECKYTLGALMGNEHEGEFTYKIVPSGLEEANFDFKVDGRTYGFRSIEDLTPAFNITQEKSELKISWAHESMQAILEAIYPQQRVILSQKYDIENTPFFMLEVTSYNGKFTVRASFTRHVSVTEVILDKSEVDIWK